MQQNQILMLVGVFVLGMLVYHMLKGMCGCKLVEGFPTLNLPELNLPSRDALDPVYVECAAAAEAAGVSVYKNC
jgi:hypothetical protein